MSDLSIKGIAAGILTFFILIFPLSYMADFYYVTVYSEVVQGVDLTEENTNQKIVSEIIFHPLSIAFGLLSIFIGVGFPCYISALVSNKGFIKNSLAIGFIILLVPSFNFHIILQFPVVFIISSFLILLVAFFGGFLRAKQLEAGIHEKKL